MSPPAAAAAPPGRRARSLAPGRPLAVPPRPRRVSGPAPRRRVDRAPVRRGRPDGLALGLASALHRIFSHRALDRLIRGRTWIFIVAFALIGIVTLQLGLLKLNSGIGRSIERSASLQTENATLSVENSELASGGRVEAGAARLGMQIVPAGALKFLGSGGRADIKRAADALRTPSHPARTEASAERSATSPERTAVSPESSSSAESAPPAAPAAATARPEAVSAEAPAASEAAPPATTAPATTAPATSEPAPAGQPSEAATGGGTSAGASG